MRFQKPVPLKPKDKIAIVSPSAGLPFIFPWVYEQGLKRLREVFNLEPVEFPTARQSPAYLSQNPKARADDINRAFADPSIKGVFATIGGSDQIKILPFLDKEIIAKNPKIFLGYSDNTNLHLFLWNLGIVSHYGGAIMVQFAMGKKMHAYTVDSLKKALFSHSLGQACAAPEYTDADLDWADPENLHRDRPMYPGLPWEWHQPQDEVIEGRLWGGCLEVLHLHLSDPQFLPQLDCLENSVLFIETSEHMPSEDFIRQFVRGLAERGFLRKFRAILVGYPKAQFCGRLPPEGRDVFIENQRRAIKRALTEYGFHFPVIFNLNFGHTDPQLILPSGGMVRIDGTHRTIDFR